LVLVDTRAEADSPEGRRAREAAAALARERGAAAIADEMLPKSLTPATLTRSPEMAEQVRSMMAATPVAGIVGALGAMRDRSDSTALLPTLGDIPTLILVGELDEPTPPARAQAMAEAIPGARCTVIPGVGHLSPVEGADQVTQALLDFLRSL
jgi:3-oxoadipate enol-lactonase